MVLAVLIVLVIIAIVLDSSDRKHKAVMRENANKRSTGETFDCQKAYTTAAAKYHKYYVKFMEMFDEELAMAAANGARFDFNGRGAYSEFDPYSAIKLIYDFDAWYSKRYPCKSNIKKMSCAAQMAALIAADKRFQEATKGQRYYAPGSTNQYVQYNRMPGFFTYGTIQRDSKFYSTGVSLLNCGVTFSKWINSDEDRFQACYSGGVDIETGLVDDRNRNLLLKNLRLGEAYGIVLPFRHPESTNPLPILLKDNLKEELPDLDEETVMAYLVQEDTFIHDNGNYGRLEDVWIRSPDIVPVRTRYVFYDLPLGNFRPLQIFSYELALSELHAKGMVRPDLEYAKGTKLWKQDQLLEAALYTIGHGGLNVEIRDAIGKPDEYTERDILSLHRTALRKKFQNIGYSKTQIQWKLYRYFDNGNLDQRERYKKVFMEKEGKEEEFV